MSKKQETVEQFVRRVLAEGKDRGFTVVMGAMERGARDPEIVASMTGLQGEKAALLVYLQHTMFSELDGLNAPTRNPIAHILDQFRDEDEDEEDGA